MSDLESKAVEILDKLESITINYAADVTTAAIEATRISAINELASCAVGALLLFTGLFLGKKLTNYFVRKKEAGGYYTDWEIGFFITGVVTVILGVIGGIKFVFGITDIWMWVTIFNPELGLAHKITGL